MTGREITAIENFESLVQEGSIKSFSVHFSRRGLLLKATEGDKEQEMPLPEDMVKSIGSFFYGMDSVAYRTFDYTSLKSLLNARSILNRMLHRK